MENTIALPFRRLVPDELIGGNTHYRIPEGQIIFFHEAWESFVITTIEEQDDFTVESYDTLPEGAPYQLIHGKLVFMPAPHPIHQEVAFNLTLAIGNYIKKNKLGKFLQAPVDVQFDDENVFQPDLLFISIKRQSIIKQRVFGAPEFIVEILSSNAKSDRGEKFEVYEKHGVVEYWIVHPTDKYVEIYHNIEQKLELVQKAEQTGTITSKAIEGLTIDLEDVFDYEIEAE